MKLPYSNRDVYNGNRTEQFEKDGVNGVSQDSSETHGYDAAGNVQITASVSILKNKSKEIGIIK